MSMLPDPKPEPPSTDALIDQIDPDREYELAGGRGALTYAEVVEGCRSGRFRIEQGFNRPVIREVETNWPIRGSGTVIRANSGPQQQALAEFRRMALDDVPFAYQSLINGMKRGDPRYDKIFWENLVGKMGENRGGDAVAEAFKALIEAMQQPEVREARIIDQ